MVRRSDYKRKRNYRSQVSNILFVHRQEQVAVSSHHKTVFVAWLLEARSTCTLRVATQLAEDIGRMVAAVKTFRVRVRVRVTLQLTVSQSVCLGVEPN
jgi:hypothetical protein